MARFVHKAIAVDAVQLRSPLVGGMKQTPDFKDEPFVLAKAGEWLVVYGDGHQEFLSDAEFRRRFEVAP